MGGTDEPACPGGEAECFDDFFRREFIRVVAWLMSLGFGKEDARDASGEAMALACRDWGDIRYPAAWVRAVALRKAGDADRRRREDIQRAVKGDWAGTSSEDGRTAVVDEVQRVVSLLRKLPDQQRLVMACHLDGLSKQEIAELTGLSSATVRSHLRHARKALKESLAQEERREGEDEEAH